MKREFLKGLGLEGDVIKQIMDEAGREVEEAKKEVAGLEQQIATQTTEIAGLKEQLTQRDADLEALKTTAADNESLKTQLSELQAKYTTDTDVLSQKLKEQQVEFDTTRATETFFADVEFSSQLAKEAAIAQFKAKGFKLADGTFQGSKEWLEDLKKSSPDAFKAVEPPKDPTQPPKPKFSNPNPQSTQPPKKHTLTDLMRMKNENPNMQVKYE